MLQPYGPVLPQENQEDYSTVQSGNGVISVMQRNRSVPMRDHLQQLSVQKEVLLTSDTMQRQAMDMQLQEAKRRTEEQGVVLDMRTQQLLNYTHEHVSQTRTETERRMNEQMLEGLKASHTQLNNELQVQTHNIQQEIQAQLRVEREQQLAEVENRLALQTIEVQHAVNGTEDRVRSFLQTQLDGWESKLENSKSWAQVYIRTAMEAQNREFGSKIQDAVGSSIENHFQRRHDEMARLISAQVRAELRKGQYDQEKRIQACVDDASRAVAMRVDAKIAELKDSQEHRLRDLNADIENKLQPVKPQASVVPQQSTTSILETVGTIIDAQIKAEIETIRAATFLMKPTVECGGGCNVKADVSPKAVPREAAPGKPKRIRVRKQISRAVRSRPPVALELSRMH